MSEYEFNEVCHTHKWANGFTEVKQNKLRRILGNGCNYGMMWILCGGGLIPTLICMGILIYYCGWDEEIAMSICWLVVYFGFGFLLEWICYREHIKSEYNSEIKNRKQLNLFRDFGLK